jgi:N-acetylmuramoyl-L-alanine amidase
MRSRSPRSALAGLAVGLALTAAACVPAAPPPPPATPIPGAVTIMGPSELTAAQIQAYVCHVNRCVPKASGGTWKPEISTLQMAQLFIDEGNLVGVRGDIAFCQSVLETGWFAWPNSPWPEPTGHPDDGTWPGYVLALDHNYAGIGAFTGTTRYMRKPTPTQGVRAHLQHLRNYADASSTPYNLGAPFEPRIGYDEAAFNSFVYKGQAPTWVQLNGKWAVPGTTYGQTILSICNNMRTFNGLAPLTAQTAEAGAQTAEEPGSTAAHEALLAETTGRN